MFYNCYEYLSLPHRQDSIDFSLVLLFEDPSYYDLNDINGGILLKATDRLNYTKNLTFYYSTEENNNNNDPDIVPIVISHRSIVASSKISASFNNSTDLLNFTINGNEILNRISSISWEQYNMSSGQDCDMWSLDNLAVTVQYENCTREVFNEDFEGDFK